MKIEKRLQKIYRRYYNLLIAEDLWKFIKYLSNIVNNLSEGIHRIKCKYGHHDKKCEIVELNHCNCVLEYTNAKDNLIECKCLSCNKSYQRKSDEKLK